MLGQEKSPGLTPPIVFAICMAMLVLALGASVVAGRQDSDSGPVRAFFDRQFASLMSGGSAPGTPEPTGAADVAAAVVATDTGTALVAAQPATLHASVTGSPQERPLLAGEADRRARRKSRGPILPLWIAPGRIVPCPLWG
jgi:hypothetical protein